MNHLLSCHSLHWICPVIVLLVGSFAQAATLQVFLVGGQSNAVGRGSTSTLPANLQDPQPDIPYYFSTGAGLTTLRPRETEFGPEITFGRGMADYFATTGEQIALLKYAVGGTNLFSEWKAGGSGMATSDGTVYQDFQATIGAGLAALQAANPGVTLALRGMIWMQGESDAIATQSANYQGNLTAFIGDIRLTYGADLPFVIGRLSVAQTGTGSEVDRNNVRTAQDNVAANDPFTALVNTDSFGLSDNLHFDGAGQQALGSAFASSMQTLVPEPTSAVLLLCGAATFGLRRRRLPTQFVIHPQPAIALTQTEIAARETVMPSKCVPEYSDRRYCGS